MNSSSYKKGAPSRLSIFFAFYPRDLFVWHWHVPFFQKLNILLRLSHNFWLIYFLLGLQKRKRKEKMIDWIEFASCLQKKKGAQQVTHDAQRRVVSPVIRRWRWHTCCFPSSSFLVNNRPTDWRRRLERSCCNDHHHRHFTCFVCVVPFSFFLERERKKWERNNKEQVTHPPSIF